MSNSIKNVAPMTNYFTCTLGEAAELNSKNPSEFKTMNNLIDIQAKRVPNNCAVAFPVPRKDREWGCDIFTFGELQTGSLAVASGFSNVLKRQRTGNTLMCVGLLCSSSLDFLFAWLGLMRAGVSVLLIAPQCKPQAIEQLCKACDISLLFHDKEHAELAQLTAKLGLHLETQLLFWQSQNKSIQEVARPSGVFMECTPLRKQSTFEVAYIRHTSGTSSGLPKPIIQTHNGAVTVLPCLKGQASATLSTTPLYHAGVTDCLRSWTSEALIWLFPTAEVPITAKNILSCVTVSSKVPNQQIKYFTSVPYILQILAQDPAGLEMLRKMALVGVGGAALPTNIGDKLVAEGVNLVSRYGSSECGFLMSSHRNYETDKNWQYLRTSLKTSQLQFEKQINSPGLFELVVPKAWPQMAKRNRSNGAFATSDLFEAHPIIQGAWRYHSRSDSQITLITGKKFDPSPVEDFIRAKSPLVKEVLIFGNQKQVPGALIFPVDGPKEKRVEDEIWEVVQAANMKGENHARISREMMKIINGNSPALERSSKGTIIRVAAEQRFSEDIENMYHSNCSGQDISNYTYEDMLSLIRSIVGELLSEESDMGDESDFYQYGVDSAKAVAIKNMILKKLGWGTESLPWNIVYDCGNVVRLSHYILDSRDGNLDGLEVKCNEMSEVVKQFSNFEFPPRTEIFNEPTSNSILLTGATGALGAHVLDILRADPITRKVICLVRAADDKEARSRVSQSLRQRHKSRLSDSDDTVVCLASKLGKSDLGISSSSLNKIRQDTTHVIHAAWAVNFALPLKSFVPDHIHGIKTLITLTESCNYSAKFIFCSSVASVRASAFGSTNPSPVKEHISQNPADGGSLGYSQSKWVAEAICFNASKTQSMRGRVKILRIGQLTGDTQHGIWNTNEAFPLILSTVSQLKCLPALDQNLSWLPLDIAATAVTEISLNKTQSDDCMLYHLANQAQSSTWDDLLRWVRELAPEKFNVVEPSVWLQQLEKGNHPAKRLLGFWKMAYEYADVQSSEILFCTDNSRAESEAMRRVKPVDKVLVGKIWRWVMEIPSPAIVQR